MTNQSMSCINETASKTSYFYSCQGSTPAAIRWQTSTWSTFESIKQIRRNMIEISPSQFKAQTEPTRLLLALIILGGWRLYFYLYIPLPGNNLVIVSAKQKTRVPLCFCYVETGKFGGPHVDGIKESKGNRKIPWFRKRKSIDWAFCSTMTGCELSTFNK